MLKGCDISAYQDRVPSGQDFVIVKATEGYNYTNSHFVPWYGQLKKAGTLKGVYHFAHPNNDATREANYFLNVIDGIWEKGDTLNLDLEAAYGQTPSHVALWAKTWMNVVEKETGVKPVLYTFRSFITSGYCAGLEDHPLWIADPNHDAGKPTVPAPFKSWVLHQFGEKNGFGDLDVFNGDAAAWHKLGGLTSVPKKPVEIPRTVKKGSTAKTVVKKLQEALNDHGYELKPDGVFGDKTLAAVEDFQEEHHLQKDGVVGPITWKALLS